VSVTFTEWRVQLCHTDICMRHRHHINQKTNCTWLDKVIDQSLIQFLRDAVTLNLLVTKVTFSQQNNSCTLPYFCFRYWYWSSLVCFCPVIFIYLPVSPGPEWKICWVVVREFFFTRKKRKQEKNGETCRISSFIVCTPRLIFLEWLNDEMGEACDTHLTRELLTGFFWVTWRNDKA